MLERMGKAKAQWERRQAEQETEVSTLKASLEELNRRSQARSAEIEKLDAANLEVAKKESELELTLKVLREEHRAWQEKDITLSKELNAVRAQAEDSMRRAKQVIDGVLPASRSLKIRFFHQSFPPPLARSLAAHDICFTLACLGIPPPSSGFPRVDPFSRCSLQECTPVALSPA